MMIDLVRVLDGVGAPFLHACSVDVLASVLHFIDQSFVVVSSK